MKDMLPLEEISRSDQVALPRKRVTSNIEAHLGTIITSIEINSIEWPIFSVGNSVALIGLLVITDAKL